MIFAAARSHKFSQLADTIDTAFARWDRSHLYKFEMADGRLIGQVEVDDFDVGFIDGAATKLSTLALGERFAYEFDFGDSWTHLCAVGAAPIDRESGWGIVPQLFLSCSSVTRFRAGWGAIPRPVDVQQARGLLTRERHQPPQIRCRPRDLEDWRCDCNANRPHSAHCELTPTEFALGWTTTNPKTRSKWTKSGSPWLG